MERQGITFTFAGETIEFDKSVDSCKKGLAALRKDYQYLKKEFKQSPSMDSFNSLLTNLRDKEKLLNTELQIFKDKLDDLNRKGVRNEEWIKLTNTIKELENKLQDVRGEIGKFTEKSATIEVLAQKFENVSKKLDGVGRKLQNVGNSLKVFSAGAGAALGLSAGAAINFEDAMASVKKTVDETDTIKYEDLADSFREMSMTIPSSASAIAEVAAIAGQLGVKTENIEEFTRAVIDLSNSTDLSGEDAATNLAQIFNITGSDLNDVNRFASVLVQLGNNSATTESRILEMATRLAAASRQIGLSDSNLLALSTTLSSVGLNAEAAGSSISTILRTIDKDVAINDDGVEKWASVVGMSTKKFVKLWKEDAYSAITKVIAALGDAKDSGGNLSLMLEEMGVKNIRQTDSMSRLANASSLMADMTKLANDEWKTNTALIEEASKRYATTKSKVEVLKNSVTNLGIELGDELLPGLTSVIDKLKEMTVSFTNMDSGTKKALITLLAFVAGLSPFFTILGKIVTTIGKLAEGIKLLMFFFESWMIPVAAIIALLVGVWTASEDFRKSVIELASAIGGTLFKAFEIIRNGFVILWNIVKPALKLLGDTLAKTIIPTLKEIWEWLDSFLMPVLEVVIDALAVSIGVAIDTAVGAFTIFIGIISEVIEAIKTLFGWLGNIIEKIGTFLGLSKKMDINVGRGEYAEQALLNNKYGIDSRGYGNMASGGYTFNNSISINTSRAITANDVKGWGKVLADSINMELGRRM